MSGLGRPRIESLGRGPPRDLALHLRARGPTLGARRSERAVAIPRIGQMQAFVPCESPPPGARPRVVARIRPITASGNCERTRCFVSDRSSELVGKLDRGLQPGEKKKDWFMAGSNGSSLRFEKRVCVCVCVWECR